jgi:hypothetical protein
MNAPNPQVGDPVFNPGGGPPRVGSNPGLQFNPGALNRTGQIKPGIGSSMMPTPSPAMNAPNDGNGGNGKNADGNKGLGSPDYNNNPGSPRDQPPPNVGSNDETAPPMPAPGSQPNPHQQQQQQLGNQKFLPSL